MPVILAQLLRPLVMSLVTGGGIAAIQAFFSDSMKSLVESIRSGTGVSEQDAKDILSNFLIDTLTNTGVTFALLKARLPVKVADYLGLSGSTGAKKILTPAAAKAVETLKAPTGATFWSGALGKVVKVAASATGFFWLVNMLAQIIEPGIYKPEQTNAVYRKLGIPWQYPVSAGALQPGPFDGPGFNEYARSLETQNISAINNPNLLATFVYSRQALADIIDYVYGQEVLAGRSPTKAKIIPLIAPYLVGAGKAATAAEVAPTAAVAARSVPSVKVFTGVVSQGVLGAGLSFQARPDDLIENAAELQAAVANNLAATLAALPASLSYEVKVASSVTTRDGFTQRGTAQRVVSGYNKDGSPKYRTVVNKFAVLSVYLVNEKGTRTKIRQIVVGPTDAVRFQPTTSDLAAVEASVKNNVVTSDTSEIQRIVTSAPLAVASLPDAPATVVQPDPLAAVFTPVTDYKDSGYRYYKHDVNGITYFEVLPWAGNVPYGYTPITRAEAIAGLRAMKDNPRIGKQDQFENLANDIERGKYDGGSGYTFVNGVPWRITTAQEADRNKQLAAEGYLKEIPVGNGVGYVPTGKTASGATAPSAVCASQTLYELAQARGERLPTVAERAPDYERLGLGPASFYTGTAEQNTRLLRALQKEAGCGA